MKKTNEMIYNNILQKLKASKKPNELEGKMISGEEIAKEALRLAVHKLPIKCKIVSREALEGGDNSEN